MELKIIAHMKSDFPTKFGLPRQSGLVEHLKSYIVFEKEYAVHEALRGLEDFSHVWIIWGFSETQREDWSPTVRPPRLGGNKRMGVFATRSPYRPNPIGLSSVKLLRTVNEDGRLLLEVAGADLMDGTPIYDIKPYLPFADSHPEATGGFADPLREDHLSVKIEDALLNRIPLEKQEGLIGVLKGDPRPSYHNDPERIYGFLYAGYEVKFRVSDDVLTVCDILEGDHEP
jgi:tRNA-Thr(GGU) m(6)t(6)A37 methyltransferase TsaA